MSRQSIPMGFIFSAVRRGIVVESKTKQRFKLRQERNLVGRVSPRTGAKGKR